MPFSLPPRLRPLTPWSARPSVPDRNKYIEIKVSRIARKRRTSISIQFYHMPLSLIARGKSTTRFDASYKKMYTDQWSVLVCERRSCRSKPLVNPDTIHFAVRITWSKSLYNISFPYCNERLGHQANPSHKEGSKRSHPRRPKPQNTVSLLQSSQCYGAPSIKVRKGLNLKNSAENQNFI